MQSSGESEYSGNDRASYVLKLSFWQNFLLILAGAAGLISLVADFPRWLTYVSLGSVVVLLLWIIATRKKK